MSLDEGLDIVIPLHNIEVPLENNNAKLVHLSGSLVTDKVLRDGDYGITIAAVQLRRNVEMYQWVETAHER